MQDVLKEIEKRWLERAYRQYKTTYEMADYLGLSQATVVRRLKKYNINSK
ncbi:TyrR/PhhR family helix-turn-helix DNA-binding protein [Alteribacillus bidgolensis]|nr:TyrR/PhhR family helix-turn-helix DNA-binding protein [Alteribacillus bidgolensis]